MTAQVSDLFLKIENKLVTVGILFQFVIGFQEEERLFIVFRRFFARHFDDMIAVVGTGTVEHARIEDRGEQLDFFQGQARCPGYAVGSGSDSVDGMINFRTDRMPGL